MPVLDPVSPQGLASAHLLVAILLIGAGIFLLVAGWTLVNVVRFRYRPGQGEPYQDFGRRKLELTWTIAPAVLLVIIFVFTLKAMGDAEPSGASTSLIPALVSVDGALPDAPRPDLIVTGEQWWWEVKYPQTGVVTANEIYLPVGKRLLVQLESDDVIHSLWIPSLGPKVDLVPGQTNYMWLEADRPGTYLGQCSEFCGTAHAWMRIDAIAVSQAQFESWRQQQLQPAPAPISAQAMAGARFFQSNTCVDCHAIAGTPANAHIGPDLTHFASRHQIAGGVLDNTPQNVAKWLQAPNQIKPEVHMPTYHLTDADLAALTAYLETLK